ncbi:MAG: hypothetical protein Q9227_004041 [Pyrenula ochraceoflavens]
MIRVDGNVYTWLGAPSGPPLVNQNDFTYTATQSIFTQNIAGVQIVTTFLSSITPNDLLRSSLPFSYMNVEVSSLDGSAHNVQLYTDISAEWISSERNATAEWDYGTIGSNSTRRALKPRAPLPSPEPEPEPVPETTYHTYATKTHYDGWRSAVPHPLQEATTSEWQSPTPTLHPKPTHGFHQLMANNSNTGGIAYHKVYRQTQLLFTEILAGPGIIGTDQAEWGNWYYSTANVETLTHQSGADVDVRGQFINNGVLDDTEDTNFRAINDRYPVFAFAKDLGNVTSAVDTLFSISLHQDLAVQFEGASGNVSLPSLWKSYYSNDLDAIDFFYNDYSTISSLSTDFNNKVQSDSQAAGGDELYTLTALAARQAFGAVELTNTPDTPYLFLKEISSDGNVQTVDVIFPTSPIFLYTNPMLLKILLDPLYINQEAGFWPLQFTIHDLGAHFPNATGHNDGNAEPQPLEECGNIIIMTLAYAQRASDTAFLTQHYDILRQWNDFLVAEALIPLEQISTDDFAGSLVKFTLLLFPASALATLDVPAHFDDLAFAILKTLTVPACFKHTTLNYGNSSSWGILYNLYGDRLLSLGLVNQSVYDMQSAFYPTVASTYGVPLDTRHNYTKNDWEIWAASIASPDTKSLFISDIAKWIGETTTSNPVTDLYDTIDGGQAYQNNAPIGFVARPVVGGWFAPLALPANSTSTEGGGSGTSGYGGYGSSHPAKKGSEVLRERKIRV